MNIDLRLDNVPQVEDSNLYQALLTIHDAIQTLHREQARLSTQIVTYTSSVFVLALDRLIFIDSSVGSLALTLPDATIMRGESIEFKKIVSANNVTLTPNGIQTIDGAANLVMTLLEFKRITSDGTNWFITS
jgi:hypothetical protein